VLGEPRPHLTEESLTGIYAEGYPQGLRFTGAYIDGACLGVAGWRIVATTFCGRKLTIDDSHSSHSQVTASAVPCSPNSANALARQAATWSTWIQQRTAPTRTASTCENACR
jgi:hypothetical protein